jgi:hypothetical protein
VGWPPICGLWSIPCDPTKVEKMANLSKWIFLVPLTIAGLCFTNRYIEKPGIKIGINITAKPFCKK